MPILAMETSVQLALITLAGTVATLIAGGFTVYLSYRASQNAAAAVVASQRNTEMAKRTAEQITAVKADVTIVKAQGVETVKQVQTIEKATNSLVEKLVTAEKKTSFAEGVKSETDKQPGQFPVESGATGVIIDGTIKPKVTEDKSGGK